MQTIPGTKEQFSDLLKKLRYISLLAWVAIPTDVTEDPWVSRNGTGKRCRQASTDQGAGTGSRFQGKGLKDTCFGGLKAKT